MPTFEQMVTEPETVSSEAWPFTYLSANSHISWATPETAVLQGSDKLHWYDATPETGRIHFIVKPTKEIRIRIHSDKANWFGFRAGIPQYAIDAFDLKDTSPLLANPYGDNSSTLDVTMRGGSMLAAAAGNKGDRGSWGSEGDAFHRETENRNISQPEDSFRDNALLLNLTFPYEDYSHLGTYSLIFNQHVSNLWIQILEVKDVGSVVFDSTKWETTGDFVDTESPIGQEVFYVQERFTRIILYDDGTDMSGRDWEVSIGLESATEKWVVLVNGAVDSTSFDTYDEAELVAEMKAVALRQRQELDPPTAPADDVKSLGLMIFVGLLLVVAVFGFAKGRGGR